MRRGGRPAQGGTPATVGPRWPGHRQARPPLVGGICRPARGLPWPCRPVQRPAFPPAGGVPRAPPRANARGRRRLRRQCARRSQMRPPAGARAAAAARSRCPGSAGGRHPQRGAPGRYAGRRVRRQSRAAWPAPQAWPGWQGWPKRRRPGRRRGRPHSPHRVGAGPRRSTCAATGAGLAGGKAREAAPQGLGLAARLGGPAQRLAANLTGPGLPGLGRHISRTDPKGLAGRAAAQPPHRVGRVSGPQAAGAGGTRPARRRATDGSPFPQDAKPPQRTKEGVPTGHSLLVLLIKGQPASGSRRWQLTPAPAWQSLFYRTVHEPRGVNTGRCPVPGQTSSAHGLVLGIAQIQTVGFFQAFLYLDSRRRCSSLTCSFASVRLILAGSIDTASSLPRRWRP